LPDASRQQSPPIPSLRRFASHHPPSDISTQTDFRIEPVSPPALRRVLRVPKAAVAHCQELRSICAQLETMMTNRLKSAAQLLEACGRQHAASDMARTLAG
jgi:hypothetical protein